MRIKYQLLSLMLCLFLGASTYAQQESWRINYRLSSNGQIIENQQLVLQNANDLTYLSYNEEVPKSVIDLAKKTNVELLFLKSDTVKRSTSWTELETPEMLPETDTVLGMVCQKARLKLYSNQIEVWFTDSLGILGSPYPVVMPGYGLVLKVVRNGNFTMEAVSVEKTPTPENLLDINNFREVTKAEFNALQIKNRYVSLPVFNNEVINFGDSIVNPEEDVAGQTFRYGNGTILLKKVNIPDLKDKQIFANLTVKSNGDAYDRTGSVFVISPENQKLLEALKYGLDRLPVYTLNDSIFYQGITATENYEPPLEIMRFFTTFGVSHFNDRVDIAGYTWSDSSTYVTEVTPLLQDLPEEIWIGVFIGNYDKGGHRASLALNIYPAFEENPPQYWVKPIFNTLNIMEMQGQNYPTLFLYDSLKVSVAIPENVKNLKLYYTTTGHGGWGNGDEFNPKPNEIFVNDSLIFKHIPWRSDCATYRLLNPASGNFNNGLSSSDLSRSNWCPGTATPPYIVSLGNPKTDMLNFKVAIPMGKPEGGSFSAWGISGVLVGEIRE